MRAPPRAALLIALVACGGAPAHRDVTVVVANVAAPEDAGAAAAPPVSTTPPPPPVEPSIPLPAGANGPRDAVGMIGEAGRIVSGSPDAVLLVNTAAIRDHAWGADLRQAITGALVGWDQFMPFDLVHPTNDVDWMLLAGSMWLGHTQDNVFLARHRVPDPRADVVFKTLMQRFAGHPTNLGVPGTKSFAGKVDGAERAYLRPRSGVLAITPPADAKRVSELVAHVDPPAAVRPGELLRVTYVRRGGGAMGWLPPEITAVSVWVESTGGDGATVHVEGDCDDDEAARAATKTVAKTLADLSRNALLRLTTRALARAVVRRDGRIVRVKITLEERDVQLAATLVCAAQAPCSTL